MSAATLVWRCVGFCALVCVLLLFFFPLLQGPFQATHGPTTDFRAKQASLVLFLAIMLAAHALFNRLLFHALPAPDRADLSALSRGGSVSGSSVLRC
jgi:hypothetical protein